MSLLRSSVLTLLMVAAARSTPAQTATTLSQVRDGVYTFQDGSQSGVVLVTPEAIAVVDPIDFGASLRLRDALSARFPGTPIRHVIYTTHTPDRAIGGVVFAGARVYGHARFNDASSRGVRSVAAAKVLPAAFAPLDVNRNQLLEPIEWSMHPASPYLTGADVNKDRTLTQPELARLAARTNHTFLDSTAVAVGRSEVRVVNPRRNFATPAVYFAKERVLYTGLNPAFARDGFSFGETPPRDMLEWLRVVGALPFDTVLTGRGEVRSPDEYSAVARYAEDLLAAGTAAYASGMSVERAASLPTLQKYTGTAIDARRRANIAAIFRSLRVTRLELQGAAFVRWLSPNEEYCVEYDACLSGGETIGGTGGLRVTWSNIGVVLEAAFDDQFLTSREGFLDDEAYMQRNSRGSFLFRRGKTRPTSVSLDWLAGATVVITDTEGLERIKHAVAPLGGRHRISERATAWGATAGLNVVLPLSRSISLFVPVRATYLPKPPERWPGPVDVNGGIGFSIRLSQHIH